MSNNIKNFIKWLALKAFIINEVFNATKIAIFFVFLYDIYFALGYFCFKCNLRILNHTQQNKSEQFIMKDFHSKLPRNLVTRD